MSYGDMEATVLACLLIQPDWFKKTKLDERYFRKYKFLYIFFKEVYAMYGNLDISVLYSCIKESSEKPLTNALENILGVFAIPNHFKEYEDRLIKLYGMSKRDEWLKRKYNEQISLLNVGKIDIDTFRKNINELYESGSSANWK